MFVRIGLFHSSISDPMALNGLVPNNFVTAPMLYASLR